MHDLDAQLRLWTAGFGAPWENLIRLLLALLVSGLIGLERELRGRVAGLRTNMLVSVGACLAMIVSFSFAQRDWPHPAGFNVQVDPARMAYGVMTGMGLLCAGVILKEGRRVRGMTTAAGLWCSTALGLASGLGLYTLTIGAAILMLIVLWLMQNFESALPRMRFARLTIRREWSHDCVAQTIAEIQKTGLSVSDVAFHRSRDKKSVKMHIEVGLSARREFEQLSEKIENNPHLDLIAAENI